MNDGKFMLTKQEECSLPQPQIKHTNRIMTTSKETEKQLGLAY